MASSRSKPEFLSPGNFLEQHFIGRSLPPYAMPGLLAHSQLWISEMRPHTLATLGTTTTFTGTIMAHASITMNTGATLNGRALGP